MVAIEKWYENFYLVFHLFNYFFFGKKRSCWTKFRSSSTWKWQDFRFGWFLKNTFHFVCLCFLCFWKFSCDAISMWSDLRSVLCFERDFRYIFEIIFTLTKKNAIRAKHKMFDNNNLDKKKKWAIKAILIFELWYVLCRWCELLWWRFFSFSFTSIAFKIQQN